MTAERHRIFAASDFADLFVEPIKPGRPSIDDNAAIEAVRIGISDGRFSSAEQAAYFLSHDFSDSHKADSFRKRIVLKIEHLFS